jgi:crossover junction endodeoxyribonuclease RuvC
VRVLGIDPGSRRTGYGVVDRHGNQMKLVVHGTIAPPARMELPQRLHYIAERVGALIGEHAPETVGVEEAFYHESVHSTLVLGHVRGAILVAAVAREAAIAEYSPREIKLAVTGNGGASKQQVAFMVRRLLGLKGALSPDAADALAVAICHLNRSRGPARQRAVQAAARGLEALLQRRRQGTSSGGIR